jgi:hypothetical protein
VSDDYDECGCGCDNQNSEKMCKSTSPRLTIPDPELTNEKKFRCPIDQQLYDSREVNPYQPTKSTLSRL